MKTGEIYYKNIVIQIFRDHWERFKEFSPHWVNKDIDENVEKMLGCGLISGGYFKYICPGCGKSRKVGFTCKSRFCLRCSKVYIDKWIGRMRETVFRWIKHRHVILTVPGSLWEYFRDPQLLKKLSDCGVETIKEVMTVCNKGRSLEAGIIAVTQTAGRSATHNPHVHMLVTEGGLDEEEKWQDFYYYFDYGILRKKWMYTLLEMMRQEFKDNREVLEKVEEIYRKRRDVGLIVRAKRQKVRKRDLVGSLIKYVAGPPIALTRIVGYDGERVTYWYREHPTDRKVEVTVSVYEFIRRMIQHIMPKSFKVIKHYGLYPFRKVTRIRELLTKLFEKGKGIAQEFELLLKKTAPARSYRERMIRSFGKDPLICEDCGQEMMLYSIWHPGYGIIYSFEDDCVPLIEERDYEEKEEKKGQVSEQLCFAF